MYKSLVAFLMATTLPFAAQAMPEPYIFDPSHTHVTWHVSHFGFSYPTGIFNDVSGMLVLDEQNPAASKVSVTIKTGSGSSGVLKLDQHMQGPDFFDVAKYPDATFKSTSVEVTGTDTARVNGDLTLRGITKPVKLDVKLNKIGESPVVPKKTAGFSATALLKRSDFGMNFALPGLGDDVMLTIEAEANAPSATPAAAPAATAPAPAAPATAPAATAPAPAAPAAAPTSAAPAPAPVAAPAAAAPAPAAPAKAPAAPAAPAAGR